MKILFSVVLALALSSAGFFPAAAIPASPDNSAYYIVMRRTADDSLQIASCQLVEMSAPLESLDEAGLQRALRVDGEAYIVRLLDSSKQVQYLNVARIPTQLRGEFQEFENNLLESHIYPLKETEFVVRVPVIPNTRLAFSSANGLSRGIFSLQTLNCAAKPDKAIYTVTPIQVNGSPQNRLDIVILGDGYTSAQQSQFINDATALAANFFNISPLTEYQNFHNVYAIFSDSPQSGADHPIYNPACSPYDNTCCADSAMQSDPLRGQMVNTIFDSTFCYYNIYRLLVAVDMTDVYNVAASMPDWDVLMVIVNDPTYGGSGGAIAVLSVHSSAVEIGKHEYGHTFGLLADEYDYGTPYSCDDTDGTPANDCPANVTNATSRAQIKWNRWIAAEPFPIPTPEDPGLYNHPLVVGLFQGAYYDPTNMYRPGLDCLMQQLFRPFCLVPMEIMIMRLYQGGWGSPASGIRLIEPGTEFPATSTVTMKVGESQVFSATLLQPMVPIASDWLVDGIPTGTYTPSFAFTSSLPGTHTITLRVQDQGPYVHPLTAGSALTFQHSWTVHVEIPLYLPMVIR